MSRPGKVREGDELLYRIICKNFMILISTDCHVLRIKFFKFFLSEQKEAKEKERDAVKARDAFDDLDLNKDGL